MYRFCLVIFLLPLLAKAYEFLTIYPCIDAIAPIAHWITAPGCNSTYCTFLNNAHRLHFEMGFTSDATYYSLSGWLKIMYFRHDGEHEYVSILQPPGIENLCEFIHGGCPVIKDGPERIVEMDYQLHILPPSLMNRDLRMELVIYVESSQMVVTCAGFNFTLLPVRGDF